MSKKVDNSQKFDHRMVTNYDDGPIRKSLALYDKYSAELAHTEELVVQLKSEVAQFSKRIRLDDDSDKAALDILAIRRMQLEAAPYRIEELRGLIADLESEIADAYEMGLMPAIEKLGHIELSRIREQITAQLLPSFGNAHKARYQSSQTRRWQQARTDVEWRHSAVS